MLLWRIASAAVLAPLALAAVYLATFATRLPLLLLVAASTGWCLHEFYRAVAASGRQPLAPVGFLFGLCLIADPVLPIAGLGLELGLVWAVIASLVLLTFGSDSSADPVADWALTLAGGAYVGGLFRYALLLPELDRGLYWSLVTLLGTWCYDSAAYFGGKVLGSRRLYPAVSPGKTWEGAGAGLIATALVGIGFAPWLGIGWPAAVGLGVLIAIAATVGDLAESRLKRILGIKDMGRVVLGHGGLLDRVDSLLFAMPAVYWYARLVGALG
ncbi:MAG: phosphatidate cytidylyltransferase [Chloroflexi bacterium]|nr:phosphatidate cytidylyltransferase [Chloroflexota bacterium]